MVFKKFVFLFLFYQSFTETIFLKNVVGGSMCNIDYGDDYEDYEDYDYDELEELAIESSEHLRDLRLTLDTNEDEIHRYSSFSYQEWEFEYPKHIREFAQVLLDQELSMLRATALNGVNGLLVQFVSSESYDPIFFDRIRTKIIKFFDLNNNVIVSRKMFRNHSNTFANENGVRFAWDNTDLKILEKNVDRIKFGDDLEGMSANEGLLRMKGMVVNAIEVFGDDSDDLLIASPLAIFKTLSSSEEKKTTGYLKAMAKLFKKFREIEKYNKKQQKKEKKIKMVTSIKETKLEEYSTGDKKESGGNNLKISSIFEGNFIFRLFCAAICCVIKRVFPNCLKIVSKIMNKFINKLPKLQHGNPNDDDKVDKVDKTRIAGYNTLKDSHLTLGSMAAMIPTPFNNVNFIFGALCLTGLSLAYDVPWMVSSTPSKGGHWTGKIYFDPDAEVSSREANSTLSTNLKEPDLRPHWISDFELKKKLKQLVDDSEKIEKIWLYKKPLGEWQYTSALLYHAYVVLETNRFWWSLEKNAEGLTCQRSKFRHTVVHSYRQKKRLDTEYWVPELIIEDEGSMPMNDLVDFLYDKDFLNKPYNWKSNNCKHFAKAIFDRVAKNKYWDSI